MEKEISSLISSTLSTTESAVSDFSKGCKNEQRENDRLEKELTSLISAALSAAGGAALDPATAYTDMLRQVKSNLPAALKGLVPLNIGKERYSALKNSYDNGEYDKALTPYNDLVSLLKKAFPGSDKAFGFDAVMERNADCFDIPFSEANKEKLNKQLAIFATWINKLPSFSVMDKSFIRYLRNCFGYYKSSVDYMTRLVHKRLEKINPSLLTDDNPSTRLLIMRQFIYQFGCGKVKKVTVNKKERYVRTECGEKKGKKIHDRSKGKSQNNTNEYFSQAIQDMCEEKYGSYEEMAKNLSEDDFEELFQANPICNLAKIADSLASAYFNAQKKTREYLYIFAIAFEMKFKRDANQALIPDSTAEHDWEDLVLNLFYEFYAHNLLNDPVSGKSRLSEKCVDGHGINWRNHVEVCYVYYLGRDEMSAAEKFYRAIRAWSNKNITVDKEPEYDPYFTILGRKNAFEYLLDLEPDDFNCRFLCYLNVVGPSAPILLNRESHTAEHISNLLDNKIKELQKVEASIPEKDRKKYDEAKMWNIKKTLYKDADIITDDGKISSTEKKPLCIHSDFEKCIKRFVDSTNDSVDCSRTQILTQIADYIFFSYCNNAVDNKYVTDFAGFYDYFVKAALFKGVIPEFITKKAPQKESTKSVKNSDKDPEKSKEKEEIVNHRDAHGANDILVAAGFQTVYSGNLFDILTIYRTFRRCLQWRSHK